MKTTEFQDHVMNDDDLAWPDGCFWWCALGCGGGCTAGCIIGVETGPLALAAVTAVSTAGVGSLDSWVCS